MNDVAVVENALPEVKIWNGQRVVTFNDIDIVHQRKDGTARRNFNTNKKFFIENEDYVIIHREQCNVRNSYNGNIPPRGLTLLTESGYLMIVKSFTDDLSWDVQRRLVNSYFRQNTPKPELETLPACALMKNREKTWSEKNLWKFQRICKDMDWEMKYLHHKILSEISELYNLNFFKSAYHNKYGIPPRYNMDLINENSVLQEMADKYLSYLMDVFVDCAD